MAEQDARVAMLRMTAYKIAIAVGIALCIAGFVLVVVFEGDMIGIIGAVVLAAGAACVAGFGGLLWSARDRHCARMQKDAAYAAIVIQRGQPADDPLRPFSYTC